LYSDLKKSKGPNEESDRPISESDKWKKVMKGIVHQVA